MRVPPRPSRVATHLVATCAAAAVLWPSDAAGQGAFGPMGPGAQPGMPPGPPPSSPQGPQQPSDAPETHAAPGATDSLIPPGSEPMLPDEPLEMSEAVRARIGSDAALDEPELGREEEVVRRPYGLYYEQQSGQYRFRTIFPLWLERTQPSLGRPEVQDRASLFGGLYYNRRGAGHADDILFPAFWNLRRPGSRTTIVGPYVSRVAEKGAWDNWIAPLYFIGARERGGYTVIPPLLTYLNNVGGDGGFNLIGPAFCSWKGGAYCDTRTAKDLDAGIAPLFFYGKTETSRYQLIPPLLHYYSEDEREQSWVNVWGPVYRRHTEDREALHVFPFYYSLWGQDERHTTLLPFFHYGWKGESSLFINPFYMTARGEEGERTFATWGYARYRGRTELDMITPLYWHYRDPDIGLDQKLLFPFLYSRTSPRESDQLFFPFWGHFERFGVSETTWITPFFQHGRHLRGWFTNIHPILYTGRSGFDTHLVVAPFFWDFASRSSRVTIGFPAFWRFADGEGVSQLVGNVYYREKKVPQGLDWEFHLFPVFSYGGTPDGHWWNLFYGLAGYTRRGETVKVRTLWIPITVNRGAKE